MSTTNISRNIGLRYATTKRELNICLQLGIVERNQKTGQGGEAFIWTLNEANEIFAILPDLDKNLQRIIKPLEDNNQLKAGFYERDKEGKLIPVPIIG